MAEIVVSRRRCEGISRKDSLLQSSFLNLTISTSHVQGTRKLQQHQPLDRILLIEEIFVLQRCLDIPYNLYRLLQCFLIVIT